MKISREDYALIKVDEFQGRYLDPVLINNYLHGLEGDITVSTLGTSVENREIKKLQIGDGSLKILMWSQMHGNETTTTKAVIDMISYIVKVKPEFFKKLSLDIIPVLNPDGAHAYIRENAAGVDLNRDAQKLSQPESKALRKLYNSLNPDYCFNLHDQRTLYNVGDTALPATLSFLAPAMDKARTVNDHRTVAMQLIATVASSLQDEIPGQIGRYSDAFNPKCVGDTFMALGTPTVLFEAGHFQGDYQRERTREFVFKALILALEAIANEDFKQSSLERYSAIPENGKQFVDILIKNAHLASPGNKPPFNLGLRFEEVMLDKEIRFNPVIEEQGSLENYFGHLVMDASIKEHREKIAALPDIEKLISSI